MSDGNGNGPVSTTEALRQWLRENEKHAERVEAEQDKKDAYDAAFEQVRASSVLQSIVRERAAKAFRASGERVRDVANTLSQLLAIREGKLTELVHLVTQSEKGNSLLNDELSTSDTEEARPARAQVDDVQWDARQRIVRLVGDLTCLESDLASAFGTSKTLDRARGLVADYENDGLAFAPPAQLRGNLKRRMQLCVYVAFGGTIVVVEKVYNDSALLGLNDKDFASAVRQRLSGRIHSGVLSTSATMIEVVRLRHDPGAPRYEPAEDDECLLHHLRTREFLRWLRPLGRDGGEGCGPKVACFRLIANMTGLSWNTVRNYVADEELERERDGAPELLNLEDPTSGIDLWSPRELLAAKAAIAAEIERRRVAEAERQGTESPHHAALVAPIAGALRLVQRSRRTLY